ncbi:patatin-like phospholipase family protein [Flavobacterium zepuense]|uniref:Patatin-like phospholipase family protein n=1 Tax=Flavobacterium zepuense TaxID=2593302 RepID=A0A552V9X3_9FLAO|nr:patatin-like phospholipase family protein [Flavobacterium zepuense]TRW27264.1 patatin-like phospholipase family protein [Flavobacterium zepuense]
MGKKFEIGLCMAGAVSAGAYTAGVMDFLIEALSDWEERRGEADVPKHEVCIPIMGGASAGGMTALLTASTINNTIEPVQLPELGHLLDNHPENKLYNSWVDLTGGDMFSKMLSIDDMKSGKVISLLNSEFIDEVAEKMLKSNIDNWIETPAFFKRNNTIPLKVFTTLTNLEGFSYYAGMNAAGKKDKYHMNVHNDYACFEVIDGIAQSTGKAWMPLNFKTGEYLNTAKDAAMATGAFPIGLSPRVLTRNAKFVQEIPWLKNIFANSPLEHDVVTSLNVDGGVINNEPFEKVRYLLNEFLAEEKGIPFETPGEKDAACSQLEDFNSDYNTFENTVLMIDPFPSAKNSEFTFEKDLLKTIPKTLSAMLSQMRSKPTEYREAIRENDASSFIISPSRDIRDKDGNVIEEVFGEKAIACGTLSGFGGFLSKEFRIHDYYLGRYNCEIFLRDYFTVPASALKENPIFRDGYNGVANPERYASAKTEPTAEKQYQIIPIFSDRSGFKIPQFSSGSNWPVLKEKELERFNKPLRKRIEKIVMTSFELKGISRPLIFIGTKVIINKLLAGKVIGSIKKSLAEWKLLG